MRAIWPLLAALLFLAACSSQDLMEKMSSPEHVAAARGYIDQLRARDYRAISNDLDESLRGPGAMPTLQKMAAFFPAGEPASVKLVGVQTHVQADTAHRNMTFELDYGERWLLANVALQDKDGRRTIVGFNVYPRQQSLESENRFALAGKSPLHYAMLAAAVVIPLFTLYALVACIRTNIGRRKWLWIAFIVLGIGQLSLNWTTGEWNLSPVSVLLFGAGAFASPYGPWLLSVGLPLGAMVFLLWRRRRAAQGPAA